MLKPRFVHRLLRPRDYQTRPELAAVCRWWRTQGVGVCALEGIGGAGKTAVVERFLRMLPGVIPEDGSVSKDTSLPVPAAVFVFSFYDAPNPETFFWELAAWLTGEAEYTPSSTGRPPYGSIGMWLSRLGSVLIVLDGLEKVQDDGARGRQFGTVTDAHLRDFLIRAADGLIADVGILITTRFTMHDMYPLEIREPQSVEQKPLPHFRSVTVDRLPPDACATLFRNLGVDATSEELDRLGRECGYHALTVDLFAGYIVRFLSGSAKAALATPLSVDLATVPDSTKTIDRGTEYVRQQMMRFTRVAARYREALSVSDPAALALLQRSCFFRLGVTADSVTRIFLDPVNREVAGPYLSQLKPDDVIRKLEFLVQLHLIEGTGRDAGGRTVFTTHPAVRDGFLNTVDQETARHTHDAARRDIVASLDSTPDARLDLRPGERYPTDRQVLDRLEELIHHSLESGYAEEAYELYSTRIGASRNLASALGDYERGARLCASLLADKKLHRYDTRGNPGSRSFLYVDWAVYLAGLGQVDRALECFEHEAELVRKTPWHRTADISRSDDVAGLHLLAGRLATAMRLASENLRSGVRAHARALRGDISGALQDFQLALPTGDWRPSAALLTRAPLFSLPALYHCSLLARFGPADEAARATAYVKADIGRALSSKRHMYEAPANLLLAELAAQMGDFTRADAFVGEAHEWALERGAREILCWAALTRARIANAKARQNEARLIYVPAALEACRNGLRIARESGFAIYHADLALELAQALLYQGDHRGASNAVKAALFGHQPVDSRAFAYDAPPRDEATPPRERLTAPTKTSGLPQVLAATHPECNYAWAEGLGLHLLAEASALAAADAIGMTQIDETRAPIGADVREQIARAAQYATAAMTVRRTLGDPLWNDTHAFADRLKRGELTSYPVIARATTSSGPGATSAGPRVFVSYAHADNDHSEPRQRWLDRLLEHLAPLVRQRELSIWSDRDLQMGDPWHDEIGRSVGSAIAAVLLVSPAFLASSYIRNSELPVLLKKGRDEGLVIIPILLRPCLFVETTFRYPDPVDGPDTLSLASLQTANTRARALSAMSETEQDETLVAVARHLLKVIQPHRLATGARGS